MKRIGQRILLVAIAACAVVLQDFSLRAAENPSIPIKEPFTRIAVSPDGQWAALFGGAAGVRLLSVDGKLNIEVEAVDGPVADVMFDEDSRALIVFEPSRSSLETKVHRVAVPVGQNSSTEVAALPRAPTVGPEGSIFYADELADELQEKTVVQVPLACLTTDRSAVVCSPTKFGPFTTAIADIAYVASQNYLIVSPLGGPARVFDARSGRSLFGISPPPLEKNFVLSETSIDTTATPDGVTVYLAMRARRGDTSEDGFLVADINPAIPEWFPAIAVQARDDEEDWEGSHPLGTAAFDSTKWADAVPTLKVAAADNDQVIVARDGDSTLVQLRREERMLVVVDRFHAEDGRTILDFALTGDGRTLVVLLPNELAKVALDPDRDPFRSDRDTALIAAIQRKLAQLGFHIPLIDGRLKTVESAIERFQAAEGIKRRSHPDASTIAEMFADDPQSLPLRLLSEPLKTKTVARAFEVHYNRTLGNSIKYFKPKEFISADAPNCGHDMPPPEVWPNLAPLAVVLNELRQRMGEPLKLKSVYQTQLYSKCVGTPDKFRSAHAKMRAALIAPMAARSTETMLDHLRALTEEGYPVDIYEKTPLGVQVAVLPPKAYIPALGGALIVLASDSPIARQCVDIREALASVADLLGEAKLGSVRLVIVEPRSDKEGGGYRLAIDAGSLLGARNVADRIRSMAQSQEDAGFPPNASIQSGEAFTPSWTCFGRRVLN